MKYQSQADLIRRVAEVVYGERWKAPLCREMRVTGEQLRGWLEGDEDIPDWVMGNLQALLDHHVEMLDEAVKWLDEQIKAH